MYNDNNNVLTNLYNIQTILVIDIRVYKLHIDLHNKVRVHKFKLELWS
jgi:hypothetical protein